MLRNSKSLCVVYNIFAVLFMCLMTGASYAMEQQLLASDAADFDAYGSSSSVDGDTAIIGALNQNDNGTNSGAAYVVTKDINGIWLQQAKLTAAEGIANDYFGTSVSVSGDLAIVGAPGTDDNGDSTGAAYIYSRDNNDVWTQQARLTASDSEYLASFGGSVAISGTTVIVGARSATNNQIVTGAAYVFEFDGISWNQQAKLTASDGAEWDNYGRSVAISGDTVVIGATGATANGFASGAAYVYLRTNSVWNEQSKLIAATGAIGDMFGFSVSIAGDDILIGSHHDDLSGVDAGAAYVFTRTGSVWNVQAKLTASDGAATENFGASVAITNNAVLVGAFNHNGSFSDQGAAYYFEKIAGNWLENFKYTASDAAINSHFGYSVAASVDSLIIGANTHSNNGVNEGSAYYYPNENFNDIDGDGIENGLDNCPLMSNSTQDDLDGDGVGDVCDIDIDGDGVDNVADNCPIIINPNQDNNDGDNDGDACDADDDNDGLTDDDEINIHLTDPLLADTDGDLFNDGIEISVGTDPLDINSFPFLLGDVNNDALVNGADLLIAQLVLQGSIVATPAQLIKLDVAPLVAGVPAPDGQFNSGDYAVLVRRVIGEISF